jgi:hypothetical protein
VANDLVVGSVEDGHLALEDRDQGVALIADAKQNITTLAVRSSPCSASVAN